MPYTKSRHLRLADSFRSLGRIEVENALVSQNEKASKEWLTDSFQSAMLLFGRPKEQKLSSERG